MDNPKYIQVMRQVASDFDGIQRIVGPAIEVRPLESRLDYG